MKKQFLILLLLISSLSALAQPAINIDSLCSDKDLESLPIQAGGRVKPLIVHASEALKFITGEKSFKDTTPVGYFCKLSMGALMPLDNKLHILVEHVDTKTFLEMSEDQKTIDYDELTPRLSLLEMEYKKTQDDGGSYHKDINKVLLRAQYATAITNGDSWSLYESQKKAWLPLNLYLTPESLKLQSDKTGESGLALIKNFILGTKESFIQNEGDHYLLELTYFKANFFSWAMVSVLLAIICLTLFKRKSPGIFFALLAIAIEIAGMVLRISISGRAPVTNMYETVMFSGFGALVISLIILQVKKDKLYLYGGLGYNFLCLLMLNFAHGMLDESISPLVPVLRDNFWLSTHVTCIILSYAALALSWMTANLALIQNYFQRLSSAEYKKRADIVYTCIKVGSVLLSAGIILGGIWADYSWGRFWGWDPKETWSLIVLLIYIAILHGRLTNWISKERFIPLAAAAFMSVMMAWFGVNYILASGLHSYGFSEGGAIFLGSFFIVQTFIVLATLKKPLPVGA